MTDLLAEKAAQAAGILGELDLDVWLTFVRETSQSSDPALALIYGSATLTWQSALLLAKTGERIAIVGHFDAETARRTGVWTDVVPYHESIREPLRAALDRLAPRRIAINTSLHDVAADGLTHGMYRLLLDLLAGSPYAERLESAEEVLGALRGRKTPEEVRRLRGAIATSDRILAHVIAALRPGMTELEAAELAHERMREEGVEAAWDYDGCPIVNFGPDSVVGHAAPSAIALQPGMIAHFDFGVKQEEYCADLQRVAYLCAPGETEAPEPVRRAFATIIRAIEAAVAEMRPGRTGIEIDAVARGVVTAGGYEEYKYGTGHHLGRNAHDGAGILGPAWERYGTAPHRRLEAGHVYTVEPGVAVPGSGYVGIEEDVLVTEGGGVYLGKPQRRLIMLKSGG